MMEKQLRQKYDSVIQQDKRVQLEKYRKSASKRVRDLINKELDEWDKEYDRRRKEIEQRCKRNMINASKGTKMSQAYLEEYRTKQKILEREKLLKKRIDIIILVDEEKEQKEKALLAKISEEERKQNEIRVRNETKERLKKLEQEKLKAEEEEKKELEEKTKQYIEEKRRKSIYSRKNKNLRLSPLSVNKELPDIQKTQNTELESQASNKSNKSNSSNGKNSLFTPISETNDKVFFPPITPFSSNITTPSPIIMNKSPSKNRLNSKPLTASQSSPNISNNPIRKVNVATRYISYDRDPKRGGILKRKVKMKILTPVQSAPPYPTLS